MTAADRHIDALVDQIDDAVVEIEIELDLGIEADEARHDGQKKMIADQRQAEAQPAARGGDGSGERSLRILEIVKHTAAALVKQPPLLRQPYAARRALEEPHADLPLQRRHGLADVSRRQAKHASGGDEAAEIGGFHEGRQAAELIHIALSTLLIRANFSMMNGIIGRLSQY